MFVELFTKRHRGWPWPEDSWGMDPMFGDDGWCRSCGTPRRSQSGSLVLQRKGMGHCQGAWVPNWQFDAICLEQDLADQVASRFDVELRPVAWPRSPPGQASQIVAPCVGDRWFDPDELRERTTAQHGTAGARCPECGVWRWMPLLFGDLPRFGRLPPLRVEPGLGDVDVAASPEWFGDGWNSFRQILLRRELAEMLVAASPKDFAIHEVT
jgi:hypothetical protein